MSTTARVSSAIAGKAAGFATVFAHQPALLADFSALYGTLWSHGVLDHAVKEAARIRNARITDCGY
jgi:alkylhydroperoxidase family enzyme